jgi:hypothetical protein
MTLEDECNRLMYYIDQIKELKKAEETTRKHIISYLRNHKQDGVIFKHNNKHITLMVEETNIKKNISKKEKEKKVQKILENAGVKNIDAATKEIINGISQVTLTSHPTRNKLKLKTTK